MPVKRNLLLLAFLTVWLVGWAIGELVAGYQLLTGGMAADAFPLSLWLVVWTIGGGHVLCVWLLMLRGREVLVLRADVLIVRRELFGVGRTREYELRRTKNLRLARKKWYSFDWTAAQRFWGGPIAFDYGSETVRVANGVDLAEAREILRELEAQHSCADTTA